MGILRARKHKIAYRLLSGLPDAVFAVSEQVRQHCIEVDRIDPDRVQTIYNGLDLADWDEARMPASTSGEVHVTTVGNIRRVKGHDIFIKAAALVVPRFSRAVFSIAGEVLEQEYFVELQTLVQVLNLGKHFHFVGSVTDMHKHLASADVFVLPSRSEGFSNAIVEAMAASLPVVATDVGGNAEAVRDGLTGYIIPTESPAALAAAIVRLLSDPLGATAMGAAGKALVAEAFTTMAMMGRIIATYKDLSVKKVKA
jgi:glycosyltransferase involved in cell wall biosynthesis